jgi:hypothetical protein
VKDADRASLESGISASVIGFVSFTEVPAGHHRGYNEWHLFDHMPEQFTIPGVAGGERWVLTPELRSTLVAEPPLDRVHYVTLYVMHDPDRAVVKAFFELARRLRGEDRFFEHRTAHLSGPMEVRFRSDPATAFRPNRGVHVRVGSEPIDPSPFLEVNGVNGAWTLEGEGRHALWCWLDRPPAEVTAAMPAVPDGSTFAGTLEAIDPWSDFDWFG